MQSYITDILDGRWNPPAVKRIEQARVDKNSQLWSFSLDSKQSE